MSCDNLEENINREIKQKEATSNDETSTATKKLKLYIIWSAMRLGEMGELQEDVDSR